MKIVPIIMLMIILPSLSIAASHKCADNHNKALHLYNEGKSIYDEGVENHNAFSTLEHETTSTFTMDLLFKREAEINYTENIITAVALLDTAISKTKLAKSKIEKSNYYAEKAKDYCYDDDYKSANGIHHKSQIISARINRNLFGKEDELAIEHIGGEDFFLLSVPNYSLARYELLATLIRRRMTESAIYLIEHEDINLNYLPEGNHQLLIIAAQNGSSDIAKALLQNGADIDIQKNGYTPLEIAGVSGNYDLFTTLFNLRASPFLLEGFHLKAKFLSCNLADLVKSSSYSKELGNDLPATRKLNEHQQILEFLTIKGLVQVCNLNPVVAKVNGEKIYQADIDFVFQTVVMPRFEEQNLGQKFPVDKKTQLKTEILDHIIDQLLAVQLAKIKGITVTDKKDDIENHAENMAGRFNDIPKIQFIRAITNEVLIKKTIQQEVVENIVITEKTLQRYYNNHPDKFMRQEQIRTSHILMADREKIEAVLLLAKKTNSDFADLAVEYSEGPSKIKGGDLGFLSRGQMPKAFEDSAFTIKKGEISEIIETQFGFHIIKLIGRKTGGVVPFVEVKDQLQEGMKQQQMAGEINKWTEALRSDASLEIL